MSFGKRLLDARKRKGISQDELAQHLGTKGPVIGRYERDEMKPSIEVASKMAELLDVSLDYLVGKTDILIDSKVMNRIIEIQKLNDDEQRTVFSLLDAFLRDTKTRKAYAS
jgi:transcriptional regulator with XRE-family HTH domain